MIPKDLFGKLPYQVRPGVKIAGVRHHTKAGEAYVDVEFSLPTGKAWFGGVPVNYRHTGTNSVTVEEAIQKVDQAFKALSETATAIWQKEADAQWVGRRADVTKAFFDAFIKNLGEWTCAHELPVNSNPARRIQDIKSLGFTLVTDTKRYCKICEGNKTHYMLLPLTLGQGIQYESMSRNLTKKIIQTLNSHDAYEGKKVPTAGLLPDHKFPEIRWLSETGVENSDAMSDDEIHKKFQLLTNQRNQQKREVCRGCFQTSKRGFPYGLKFYAVGDELAARRSREGRGCRSGLPWLLLVRL